MRGNSYPVWLRAIAVPITLLAVVTLFGTAGMLPITDPILGYMKGVCGLLAVAAMLVLPRHGAGAKRVGMFKVDHNG